MPGSRLVDIIGTIELFQDLSREEHSQIAIAMNIETAPEGTYLFRENEPRLRFMAIIEGRIELTKDDTFGGNESIVTFGPGDFLGEGALFDDSPHATSARAVDHVTVGWMDRPRFEQLCREYSNVQLRMMPRLIQVIARRMQETTSNLVREAAQYVSGKTRLEHDLLGERQVPWEAYYGIQTMRGMENFHITGVPLSHYPRLIDALAMVKMAAARANGDLGLLSEEVADAIWSAGQEVIYGKLHHQFILDVIQGGAGTSINMNVNEVLANRALELMGKQRGDYDHCHPLNHVNRSQSTNDAIPTALKVAVIYGNRELVRSLQRLISAFRAKGEEFSGVLKLGRTQLQDAVPMTLGQEFEAYAVTLEDEISHLNMNADTLLPVNLGGTAIGTGLNAPEGFTGKAIEYLRKISGIEVRRSRNLIEATQDTSGFVMYSSTLKHLATKLSKISNDLRLLSSGPRAGLNEINLPKLQPGSSIMPGKVNPVIPEVVNQIAFKVIGNNLAVTMASEAGQLQLNVMLPVIGASIFESIEMLKNGMNTLTHRCIKGITANEEICMDYVRNSTGLVTALNPVLGYEQSSALAKEALEKNRGIYELVLEKGLLSKEELDNLLDPLNMTTPQARRS